MVELKKYTSEDKEQWDRLVMDSKIDSFLFLRDFMDYHKDRFVDQSFMVYRSNKLVAVIPGNIKDQTFYSHQGLTFGGIIGSLDLRTADVLNAFRQLNSMLRSRGLKQVVYKPAPYIYSKSGSQEDLYTLFRLGAKKTACNLSSVIYPGRQIEYSKLRKRGIKRATNAGIILTESNIFEEFWSLLTINLETRHGVKPVHTLDEIKILKQRFPEKILLFEARKNDNLLAGCVMFIMATLVHVQYVGASDEGKKSGALDMLFDHLICKYESMNYFDFGVSTEDDGSYLNENLVFQKEGFGSRGVVYEAYEYAL